MNIKKTLETIKRENISFVRLMFTDLVGIPKNVEIPAEELPTALEKGIYFDGSSVDGFVGIEESDLILKPDINTLAILPWTIEDNKKTARFISDVYTPDGKPFEGDPRYILKKTLRKAKEMGFSDFKVGPEMEFFIFKEKNNEPTTEIIDTGGYFDLLPVDKGEQVRQDIVIALKKMGFNVETAHHEVAPSQHEIDFRYGPALSVADNVITLKLVAKTIAISRGLIANFMPKPIVGINGSGMHIHMSLFKNEKNAFYKEDGPYGGLSETMLYFIGGILHHIRAITAITNPTINSYKRLVPYYEAPTNACWATNNRSALIRVPAARGEGTRIELRNPDPSSNPYLAFAVILAAGLDGIERKITPPDPLNNVNTYDLSPAEIEKLKIIPLPTTLAEALVELEKDELLKNTLGKHAYEKFTTIKWDEWKEYNTIVHPWEIEKYCRI